MMGKDFIMLNRYTKKQTTLQKKTQKTKQKTVYTETALSKYASRGDK